MILALDQSATRTGFCIGSAAGPATTGSARFKGHGQDIGSLLAAFRSWLRGVVEAHEPEVIAFEQPVRPIAAAQLLTMRQLYSIAGMVELVARDKGIPVFEVNNSAMKRLIYGHGGKKPSPCHAMEAAREWGFAPENGDESDACGMFLMTLKHRYDSEFMIWEHRRREARVMAGSAMI